MNVSIIIINYNTYNLIVNCIKSLNDKVKNVNYEIIVVDNNSPCRDIEKINEIFPEVKLILNDKNAGFGAANNIGSNVALGKYLFFLNSDTILINNAVEILYNFLEQDDAVGICGGNLYDSKLQPAHSLHVFLPSFKRELDGLFFSFLSRISYRRNTLFNYGEDPLQIRGYVSGADIMMPKFLFDEIGGFDEDFFMYYEETELTYRVHKKGYKVFSVPEAKIIHLEGASQTRIPLKKFEWMYEGRRIYYKKTNKSKLHYCASLILSFLIIWKSIFFSLIGLKFKKLKSVILLHNMSLRSVKKEFFSWK